MTCEMAQRAIAMAALASSEKEHDDPGPDPELPDYFAAAELERPARQRSALDQFHPEELALNLDADPGELPGDIFSAPSAPVRAPRLPELPRSEQAALLEHLNTCRSCQVEMTATTAFFRALASDRGPEPSATLLARARMQLDETLDSCAQDGLWTRMVQQFAFTAGRLRAAPALSSALLFCGLLAGGYAGYRAGHAAHAEEQSALLLAPPAPEVPSVVADVSGVTRDPDTGLIEVRYDRLVPDVLTAPATDPSIRELLMAGAENGTDPRVRDIAVGLLGGNAGGSTAGCAPGLPCVGSGSVRNALLNALAKDSAPEVRREALAGLEPYIAEDMEVRDAVLGTLMNDASASVRAEAVRLLEPVDVDSSVRQVLHTVASHDGDPSIRSASLAALQSVPQVQ